MQLGNSGSQERRFGHVSSSNQPTIARNTHVGKNYIKNWLAVKSLPSFAHVFWGKRREETCLCR